MKCTSLILSIFFLGLAASVSAQDNFTDLPARLKTKMAVEEEASASQDSEYQALMTEGIERFEARDYAGAIEQFKAAQNRRPVNVYPPVLIADAELALEMQKDEPVEEVLAMVEEPVALPEAPKMTAEERVELMYQQELAKVYSDMPPAPKEKPQAKVEEALVALDQGAVIKNPVIEEADKPIKKTDAPVASAKTEAKTEAVKPVIEEKPRVIEKPKAADSAPVKKVESKVEKQERLAVEFPDGVTEETFKEGNRNVVRRVVVKSGLGNEYRKVTHAWGGTYYFKNGTSITERVWEQETVK